MRWLDSITNSTERNLSKVQEIVKDRQAWWATAHGVSLQLNNNKVRGQSDWSASGSSFSSPFQGGPYCLALTSGCTPSLFRVPEKWCGS